MAYKEKIYVNIDTDLQIENSKKINSLSELTDGKTLLSLLGYKKIELNEDTKNALSDIGSVLCKKTNKAICKCGYFINPKDYALTKHSVCLVCKNTNWKIIIAENNKYRSLSNTKKIKVYEEDKIISILDISTKFKIDWNDLEIDIDNSTVEYILDLNKKCVTKGDKIVKDNELLNIFKPFSDSNFDTLKYHVSHNTYPPISVYNAKSLVDILTLIKKDWSQVLYSYFERDIIFNSNNHLFGKPYEEVVEVLNINENATKPHEILGVSKQVLNLFKASNNSYYLTAQTLNTLRMLESLYGKDETLNIINFLGVSYSFNTNIEYYNTLRSFGLSHKSLVDYSRSAVENQAFSSPFSALLMYRDYIKMSKDIGVNYIKNPKSLKLVHDVRMRDYNVVLNENEREYFKKRYEDSAIINHKNIDSDSYKILVPSSPEEVVNEGQELNHCVSSYVSRIVKGECLILFLRNKEDITKNLVTVEYRPTRNEIVQAKGKSNRDLSKGETSYLKKWCEKNQIVYGLV